MGLVDRLRDFFLFTENWHAGLVGWSAAVFALIALLFGNFAFEALLAFIHFFWGVVMGMATDGTLSRPGRHDEGGDLGSAVLLGLERA